MLIFYVKISEAITDDNKNRLTVFQWEEGYTNVNMNVHQLRMRAKSLRLHPALCDPVDY